MSLTFSNVSYIMLNVLTRKDTTMKNKINKMSTVNKLIMGALLLIALTNPWSVGFIGSGVDTAVVYFTLYANYVFVAGLVLLVGVNLYIMWAGRERVSVSSKHYSKDTKRKNAKKSKLQLLED